MKKFLFSVFILLLVSASASFAQVQKNNREHAMERRENKMKFSSPSDVSLRNYMKGNQNAGLKKTDKAQKKKGKRSAYPVNSIARKKSH